MSAAGIWYVTTGAFTDILQSLSFSKTDQYNLLLYSSCSRIYPYATQAVTVGAFFVSKFDG